MESGAVSSVNIVIIAHLASAAAALCLFAFLNWIKHLRSQMVIGGYYEIVLNEEYRDMAFVLVLKRSGRQDYIEEYEAKTIYPQLTGEVRVVKSFSRIYRDVRRITDVSKITQLKLMGLVE